MVVSYVAYDLSVFVPHFSFFWGLGKAVLGDCGISLGKAVLGDWNFPCEVCAWWLWNFPWEGCAWWLWNFPWEGCAWWLWNFPWEGCAWWLWNFLGIFTYVFPTKQALTFCEDCLLRWWLLILSKLLRPCWAGQFICSHFSSAAVNQYLCTYKCTIVSNWHLPFLNQQKGEND